MNTITVLIAEDEKNLQTLLKRVLSQEGYRVLVAQNGQEALALLQSSKVDILLTDIRMPEIDGITLLEKTKEINPAIEVVVMTAFATVDTAIHALKMGACDYIRKPFDIDEVITALAKTELLQQSNENAMETVDQASLLITHSPKMQDLTQTLEKVASTTVTIYLYGEAGVGKELVARAIHRASTRKEEPFIRVNCAAFPGEILERELFGYEEDAFEGARARKIGRFELAEGGTLFLDEINDLPGMIQVKLLRAIQQKHIQRLGSNQIIPLDVRIITASNKVLEALVESGQVREDLFYRLNVVPMEVPPLRDRQEDLDGLIDLFMSSLAVTQEQRNKALSGAALEALRRYNWPGNVRELELIIERLLVISEGDQIQMEDLPQGIRDYTGKETISLVVQKDSTEEKLIRQALNECKWNITHAANRLGISRRSFHRKINKYSIQQGEDH